MKMATIAGSRSPVRLLARPTMAMLLGVAFLLSTAPDQRASAQATAPAQIDPELQLRELKIKASDAAALIKSGYKPGDPIYREALNRYDDAKATTNAFIDELADDVVLGTPPKLGDNAQRAASAIIFFIQYVRTNTQSAGLLDILGSVKDLADSLVKAGLDIEQRWHDRKKEEREYKAKSLKDGIELADWSKL